MPVDPRQFTNRTFVEGQGADCEKGHGGENWPIGRGLPLPDDPSAGVDLCPASLESVPNGTLPRPVWGQRASLFAHFLSTADTCSFPFSPLGFRQLQISLATHWSHCVLDYPAYLPRTGQGTLHREAFPTGTALENRPHGSMALLCLEE